MSEDEGARQLAELKKLLEERLEGLRREVELLTLCVKIVDEALSRISFVRAGELVRREAPIGEAERAKVEYAIARRKDRSVLARMLVDDCSIEIIPEMEFNPEVPPFKPFFIERILRPMKERDEDDVSRGSLSPDKVFDYGVEVKGGKIKRIVMRNYRDERRLREIRNAIRWTFERMLEKRASPPS